MGDECDNPKGKRQMERLRFRIGRLLLGIACLSAAAALVISFCLLSWYDGIHTRNTSPEPFNAFLESRDCSVQIQLLSGPFASSQDEKQNFYWGYGVMMEPVILVFTGELPESCKALLHYTQNLGTEEAPEPVTIRGRSVAIVNTDLYDYASKFYQTMWGLDDMDRNEFKQTVASCYLDTAELTWIQKLPWYGVLPVFLLPAAVFMTGVFQCQRFITEKKREAIRIASLSEEEKRRAVQQLETALEFEPGSRIYLTADFVITGNCQFDIIPYERISSFEETGSYLIAVTDDGAAHIILSSGHKKLEQISWLSLLRGALKEKTRNTGTQGEHYAAISGY